MHVAILHLCLVSLSGEEMTHAVREGLVFRHVARRQAKSRQSSADPQAAKSAVETRIVGR